MPERRAQMAKLKRLVAGALMAFLLATIGGCVYYVRGPYPLITIHRPGEYRDCGYRRDC
jgi:hypothetical protein